MTRANIPNQSVGRRDYGDPAPVFSDPACADQLPVFAIAESGDRYAVRTAVNICCGCPHVAPCAAYGVSVPRVAGVWGGLTQEQRQQLAANRRPL